jgi:acetyl esterase/lipase
VKRAVWLGSLIAMLALAACGGGSSASSAVAPAVPPPLLHPTTVTYCTDGGKALTLDIYQPAASASLHPLLLVAHGGSWAFGASPLVQQNTLTQGVAAALIARGFVVASINYRLAPADPWPAQIIDVRCAIRYLRASASDWGIDSHRFAALGNSAGAHLVSLAALSVLQMPQWDSAQYAGVSSALQAVVDCWGPIDLIAPGWGPAAQAIGRVEFQTSLGTDSSTLTDASPVSHIRAGAPPFLIIQGTADTLVPPAQASELRDRLMAAGDAARLVDVSHAGHELIPSGGAISPDLATLTGRTVAFLVATLG